MKKLIEALQFISQFMSDPDCEYPTACEHDDFYVWGVDLTKMSYQDVRYLIDTCEFMPGMDDEFGTVLECVGEDGGWDDLTEEAWFRLRDELSNCVHSYKYGSC